MTLKLKLVPTHCYISNISEFFVYRGHCLYLTFCITDFSLEEAHVHNSGMTFYQKVNVL